MNPRSEKPIRHVVLYAENEDVDLIMCERAFKAHEDIELRTVADGGSVIDWLDGRGTYGNRAYYPMPALVVLDSKLGDMSGLDVLRWMRGERRFREMPVILHVGSTPPPLQDACHSLRVTAVVEKESTCRNLVERVYDVLHGEPVGR